MLSASMARSSEKDQQVTVYGAQLLDERPLVVCVLAL